MKSLFTESAIILALSTALLYIVANTYTQGFLDTLHLDPEVLDRNFNQVLYRGFIIALGNLLGSFLNIITVLILLSFTMFIFLVTFPSIATTQIFTCVRQRAADGIAFLQGATMIKLSASVFARSFVVLTIATLILHYLASIEKKGRDDALTLLGFTARTNLPPDQRMLRVSIDGKPLDLLYLTCGSRNCAGMDLKTRRVYYFPQNGHSYCLDGSSDVHAICADSSLQAGQAPVTASLPEPAPSEPTAQVPATATPTAIP